MTDRAASEVLSFALVFGLVVASVAIVSVSGVGSLESARDAEQMNNAERAFDVLGDNMADIYERGAPSRATEISLGESQLYTDENVTFNVTVTDSSGGLSPVTRTRAVRPVVYDGDRERKLVYEAGAVFRVERQGALVLQEPPFVVENDRVLLPMVATQSSATESTGGSTVLLRANNRGTDVTVSDSRGGYDMLYFNVSSPRNDLWFDYVDAKPGFSCATTGPSGDHVECESSGLEVVHVVVYDIGIAIDR